MDVEGIRFVVIVMGWVLLALGLCGAIEWVAKKMEGRR